jgi:hypothetical protein
MKTHAASWTHFRQLYTPPLGYGTERRVGVARAGDQSNAIKNRVVDLHLPM